jgi:2-polyprenyl-6-methoxyphenol hydroxylase-like FAD-dependent oxidoreductase
MSIRSRVVILGSSFAGTIAALELQKRVGDRHEIVVIDPHDLDHAGRESFPLDELSAVCILDAGSNGVIVKASNVVTDGTGDDRVARAHLSAGPRAHLAKRAFERIYLASRKRGALVL